MIKALGCTCSSFFNRVLSPVILGGTSALETSSWSCFLRCSLEWTSWRQKLRMVTPGKRACGSSPMSRKRGSRRRTSKSRTNIWTSSSKCLFLIGRSWPSVPSLMDSWSGNVRWAMIKFTMSFPPWDWCFSDPQPGNQYTSSTRSLSLVLCSSAHRSLRLGWWAEVKSHQSPCLTTTPTAARLIQRRRRRRRIRRRPEELRSPVFTSVRSYTCRDARTACWVPVNWAHVWLLCPCLQGCSRDSSTSSPLWGSLRSSLLKLSRLRRT